MPQGDIQHQIAVAKVPKWACVKCGERCLREIVSDSAEETVHAFRCGNEKCDRGPKPDPVPA